MTSGFLILIAALLIYASFAGAIIWHLKIYAFSRSAKWMMTLFILLASALATLSLAFFWFVNWEEISALILGYAETGI